MPLIAEVYYKQLPSHTPPSGTINHFFWASNVYVYWAVKCAKQKIGKKPGSKGVGAVVGKMVREASLLLAYNLLFFLIPWRQGCGLKDLSLAPGRAGAAQMFHRRLLNKRISPGQTHFVGRHWEERLYPFPWWIVPEEAKHFFLWLYSAQGQKGRDKRHSTHFGSIVLFSLGGGLVWAKCYFRRVLPGETHRTCTRDVSKCLCWLSLLWGRLDWYSFIFSKEGADA